MNLFLVRCRRYRHQAASVLFRNISHGSGGARQGQLGYAHRSNQAPVVIQHARPPEALGVLPKQPQGVQRVAGRNVLPDPGEVCCHDAAGGVRRVGDPRQQDALIRGQHLPEQRSSGADLVAPQRLPNPLAQRNGISSARVAVPGEDTESNAPVG